MVLVHPRTKIEPLFKPIRTRLNFMQKTQFDHTPNRFLNQTELWIGFFYMDQFSTTFQNWFSVCFFIPWFAVYMVLFSSLSNLVWFFWFSGTALRRWTCCCVSNITSQYKEKLKQLSKLHAFFIQLITWN
jgi:hypothetical protein